MTRFVLVALVACGAPAPPPAHAESPAQREAIARVEAATAALRNIRESVDTAIPLAIAHSAKCVAIVPGLIQAGLVLAAREGRGLFTCRDGDGWTAPAFFVLRGAGAGVQAGVQKADILMLAMTDAGKAAMVAGHVQLGASTAIAAGPLGRGAEASGDISLAAILYYARAQGIFVGVELSGTRLDPDEESSRAFYGDPRDFSALLNRPPPVPPAGALLREEIARSFGGDAKAP